MVSLLAGHIAGFSPAPRGLTALSLQPAREPEARQASGLFDLRELEFHRRRTTEDRDRHANLVLFVVDFLDRAVEVGERAVLDAHIFTRDEFDLVARLLRALLHLAEDLRDLVLGDRRRTVLRAADETRDLVGVLHQV